VDELVRRGHSVVVLDDLSSGKEDNLAEFPNKITFIKGSITDIEVVRNGHARSGVRAALAARTSVPRFREGPHRERTKLISTAPSTYGGSEKVESEAGGVAASSSAYGETRLFLKSRPCSRSDFGLTASPKFVGELYGQTLWTAATSGTSRCAYFNIFGRAGSQFAYSGVLAKFCAAFLEDTQPVFLETVNRPAIHLRGKCAAGEPTGL